MFRGKVSKLHFVGIGGIGMSGIAEVLKNLDYDVRGSDLVESASTARLAALQVKIYLGHRPEHLGDAEVVIVSSAIKQQTNPEVLAAKAKGIPVIQRAEMLAELMRLKYGIAVAGMHGKTTTTSLIATIFHRAGLDPTMVIGGRLKSIGSNARLGTGDYLIAEADESDGSFLHLLPHIAVVTNIDAEHLDYWQGGLPQIKAAFQEFIHKVPFYGLVVLCADNPETLALSKDLAKRYVTYGVKEGETETPDYLAREVTLTEGALAFKVYNQGKLLGPIKLNMVGKHNVLNALAAMAVSLEAGIAFREIQAALADFQGIHRRFELKGKKEPDILVVDDYGHHPVEILATLSAAREAYPTRRLVVVFQPHRYTRTQALFSEFAKILATVDVLVLVDIYPAAELPIPEVTSAALAKVIEEVARKTNPHLQLTYVGSLAAAMSYLEAHTRAQDLVLTLGAGNIWQVGEQFLAPFLAIDKPFSTQPTANPGSRELATSVRNNDLNYKLEQKLA